MLGIDTSLMSVWPAPRLRVLLPDPLQGCAGVPRLAPGPSTARPAVICPILPGTRTAAQTTSGIGSSRMFCKKTKLKQCDREPARASPARPRKVAQLIGAFSPFVKLTKVQGWIGPGVSHPAPGIAGARDHLALASIGRATKR